MSHVRQGSSVLTCVRSGSSASVKRDEQDETFVVSPLPFVAETDGIAGDQLRYDIQLWLSPPDPSTNHNFVWKARHRGTAAWFFESNTFTEWKARGSLLWIHGKRMFFFNLHRVTCTNVLLILKRGPGRAHFCMSLLYMFI